MVEKPVVFPTPAQCAHLFPWTLNTVREMVYNPNFPISLEDRPIWAPKTTSHLSQLVTRLYAGTDMYMSGALYYEAEAEVSIYYRRGQHLVGMMKLKGKVANQGSLPGLWSRESLRFIRLSEEFGNGESAEWRTIQLAEEFCPILMERPIVPTA
jgi:hypothetical protein